MPFMYKYGDITKVSADAIVMPANPKPVIGNGLDRILYKLAGRNRLLEARKRIGNLDFGEAEITSAFDLNARYIVHAVSPAWDYGNRDEDILLKECYLNSLKKAYDKGCRTIAFPLLSTGVLKYPVDEAKFIAENACREFLNDHDDMQIEIYIFDKLRAKSKAIQKELNVFIYENDYSNLDENELNRLEKECANLPKDREEVEILELYRKRYKKKKYDEELLAKSKTEEKGKSFNREDFEKYISQAKPRATFEEVLDKFKIQKNAGSYAEICRNSGIREDTLSRMRRESINANRDYLWALSIGLKLDMNEAEELFASCGQSVYGRYRLQEAELTRELAFEYFIKNKIYDIGYINEILHKQKILILGNDYIL